MNNIFLPKEITVGFRKREGTYNGKLAYIIYTDEKGVLRKEKSWNGWRDKDIKPQVEENVPISGFVLNKKAGGYSTGWNHRQAYIRVYDPRGFEFEITIENLLYILENTNSIKGKGLEGEFIYGWDGKDLILMPTSSPDYKNIVEYTEKVKSGLNIKAKDLIEGYTYLTKQSQEWIYMGKFNYYNEVGAKTDKRFFFFNKKYKYFEFIRSIPGKIISLQDDNYHPDYAYLFEKMEHLKEYSPVDVNKSVLKQWKLQELYDYSVKYGELSIYLKDNQNDLTEFILKSSYRSGFWTTCTKHFELSKVQKSNSDIVSTENDINIFKRFKDSEVYTIEKPFLENGREEISRWNLKIKDL